MPTKEQVERVIAKLDHRRRIFEHTAHEDSEKWGKETEMYYFGHLPAFEEAMMHLRDLLKEDTVMPATFVTLYRKLDEFALDAQEMANKRKKQGDITSSEMYKARAFAYKHASDLVKEAFEFKEHQ